MINQIIRPVCRSVLSKSANVTSIRQKSELLPKGKTLMDLVPIPQGSWEKQFKENNTKYNIHLAAGIAFLALTVAFGKTLIDLVPIPQGSWEKQFKENNTKYNIHLAAGIAFFALIVAFGHSGGYLFLNAEVPPFNQKK